MNGLRTVTLEISNIMIFFFVACLKQPQTLCEVHDSGIPKLGHCTTLPEIAFDVSAEDEELPVGGQGCIFFIFQKYE